MALTPVPAAEPSSSPQHHYSVDKNYVQRTQHCDTYIGSL
jgi:hypothetical protein